MRRSTSVLMLAALSGALGCEPTSPTMPMPIASPEKSLVTDETADASLAAGGAVVVTDETFFLFAHYDAARGLMSVHGLWAEFCLGRPLTTTPRTIVTTPSQIAQRLVALGEESQPVVVYRTTTGALSCGLVASPEVRVASGMVRHSQTFTLASFAATWRGPVMSPDGSTHHLAETYQLTADAHDPNNPTTWSLNASAILIN